MSLVPDDVLDGIAGSLARRQTAEAEKAVLDAQAALDAELDRRRSLAHVHADEHPNGEPRTIEGIEYLMRGPTCHDCGEDLIRDGGVDGPLVCPKVYGLATGFVVPDGSVVECGGA